MKREKIFVSYSHEDKRLFVEFKKMLAPAIRRGVVHIWDDTMIAPGAKWKQAIEKALEEARIAVLLVSANFLASDFIANHELPPLLKAAEDHGLTIYWIYLSHCLYEQTEIANYQAAHDVSKPLASLKKAEREKILSETCHELIELAKKPSGATSRRAPRTRRKAKPLESSESPQRLTPRSKSTRPGRPGKSVVDAVDLYRQAIRFISDKQYDDALSALDQAIEGNPRFAEAFYNRGLTHFFMNDLDLAIEDFDHSLELGFDDVLLYRNRGNAYSRKGDVERALSDYAQAIALEPENGGVYLNRGQVYENTRQKELAKADYQTILTLACEEWIKEEARKRLTSMGVKIKKPSAALAIWQKKLAFLQSEEAKAADAAQKFSIQQSIEEAEAKIRELGG